MTSFMKQLELNWLRSEKKVLKKSLGPAKSELDEEKKNSTTDPEVVHKGSIKSVRLQYRGMRWHG